MSPIQIINLYHVDLLCTNFHTNLSQSAQSPPFLLLRLRHPRFLGMKYQSTKVATFDLFFAPQQYCTHHLKEHLVCSRSILVSVSLWLRPLTFSSHHSNIAHIISKRILYAPEVYLFQFHYVKQIKSYMQFHIQKSVITSTL